MSSEARSVLGIRAPADVGNLMSVWGVSRERAVEAATVNPRSVVVNERINRRGYRGVIDVVDGGERVINPNTSLEASETENGKGVGNGKKGKRKIEDREKDGREEPSKMSKRQEKKMRSAALKMEKGDESSPSKTVASIEDKPDPPGTIHA